MGDETVKVVINGCEYEARKGEMLIRVTDRHGIHVPRFCYHEKLSVAANCRMCLVEVEKAPKPLVACATPVTDGMKVQTRSAKALESQRATMEFLLINHPLDCPICDQGGECELQDLALGYGSGVSQYTERKRVVLDKDIGPLISTDMTRCIHCTRCIRFLEEVTGMQDLGATGRSEFMQVGTYIEKSVDHEMSGNVIDLCPVGALNSKPFRFRARGWEMTRHAAFGTHDGLGSALHAHVLRGKVMRVVPRPDETVNETWLSDRDRYAHEGILAPDRLDRPMVRRNGAWVAVEWQVALETAAAALSSATGGDGTRLGVLAGASATTEECFLLASFARGIGCSNIDHRMRQHDFRDAVSDPVYPSLGQGIDEFEQNDAVFVIGANLRKEAPILAHRLRKAAMRGARVAFLNPRHFDLHFPVLAQRIATPAGQIDDLTAMLSGKCDDTLRAILDALQAAGSTTVLLGHLAHAHPRYADLRALVSTLAAKVGARVAFLPQGGNAAGAAIAGMLPHRSAGGRPVEAPGLDARAMFERPLDAYLLHATEPELDALDGRSALAALRQASVVVVLSPVMTDAMRDYANVVLPVGTWAESAGSLVNAAGEWRRWDGLVRPYGEARPAWKVLRVLGALHGLEGFDHDDIDSVRNALDLAVSGMSSASFTSGHVPTPSQAVGRAEIVPGFTTYGGDAVQRRALPLQKTQDAKSDNCIRVHPQTAMALGWADGAPAPGSMAGQSVRHDPDIAPGVLWVPHGTTISGDLAVKGAAS